MITRVGATNFKSLSFEQALEKKNIIVGNNGSGKTARTEALILAVNGYVPGSGKQNAEILDNFGTGDQLTVEFQIEGDNFARAFKRSSKGSVSQKYYINAQNVSKDDFIGQVANAGRPKILDLSVFLGQSDQKKIDTLFELFPPGEDLAGLDADIDIKKTRINRLHEMIRNNEKLVQTLSRDRGDIELPSGNLAEIKGKMDKIDQEIDEADTELKDALAKNAAEHAKKEAKREAEAELKQIQEEANQEAAEQEARESEKMDTLEEPDPLPPYEFKDLDTGGQIASHVEERPISAEQVVESISKIINALTVFSKKTALKVANKELGKYQKHNV